MKLILPLAVILLPSILLAQVSVPNTSVQQIQQIQQMQQLQQNRVRPIGQGQGLETDSTLRENYQMTLTLTDKDNQPIELAIIIASPRFTAVLGEQNVTFTGLLTVEETWMTLDYNLAWQTILEGKNGPQYTSSNIQTSVRLKLGEEVQLVRIGPGPPS